MAGNAFTKQSPSGLFIPTKKKRYTIFFYGGGRVTVEAASLDITTDTEGRLASLNLVGSDSKMIFIDPKAVQGIECIGDV